MTEVQNIKQLRQDIDAIIQRIQQLEPCRETSLSIIKLKEAVMWLGMNLKWLHKTNSYPLSKDPSADDTIEPTTDNFKFNDHA